MGTMENNASFVVGLECGECFEVTGLGFTQNQPRKDVNIWKCRNCGRDYDNNDALQSIASNVFLAVEGQDADVSRGTKIKTTKVQSNSAHK